MYTQLKAHRAYVLEQIQKELSSDEREALRRYHSERVRDFQHERLIHLLVTFFFAFLFIGACVVWALLPLPELFWPLTALAAILLVLELAYVRHYYLLENGVQSLYEVTEKLKG